MNTRPLFLALTAALVVAPLTAQASDNFVGRALTAPDAHGRWLNRRLTLRHEGQDAPTLVVVGRGDNFASRMLTAPDGRGRWVDRRLTLRHHDQDCPALAAGKPHEDGFVARAFTAPDERGRWLNRRLTVRHPED